GGEGAWAPLRGGGGGGGCPPPPRGGGGGGGGPNGRHVHAASVRRALSKAIGPSGSPRRNWRTSGSWLACSSSGVPSKTMPPLAITIARSAIGRVSCTWWVTMMLVRDRKSVV